MNEPLISIITPCFNSEKFLTQAIDSVLAQTYLNWELFLIDDCSTDNTYSMINSYVISDERIKYIHNESNLGVAESRNKGLDLARGHFIAFLDSDDLWEKSKLEKQILISVQENANFIISDYSIINEDSNYSRSYKCPEILTKKNLLKGSFIACSSVLLKSELIGAKRFRKTFHEDYLFWLKIFDGQEVKMTATREDLVMYRITSSSLSSNKIKCAKHQWNIYRKQLNLPLMKSVYLFTHYMIKGVSKHFL